MARTFLIHSVAAVILAATAAPAFAQFTIYQNSPNSAFISRPGQPPVAVMTVPGPDPAQTYYVVPAQQPSQPNPAQQNWQQYDPSQQNWQQYRPGGR